MAKKNQGGQNKKKVVDPKGKGSKTSTKGIPVVSDDDNVHPHFRGMDE